MRKGSHHTAESKAKNGVKHRGKIVSQETRERMSEAHAGERNGFFGKHHDEATIEKNRQAHIGRPAWNKGKPMSEEMKQHLSEVKKGRKASEETKRKMSEAHKKNPVRYWLGKEKSPEHRKKFSDSLKGERNHNFGKEMSEETRLKISLAMIGKNAGDKCHLWRGGVSFEPYCPRFNEEFRNRVRAYFNYTCVECGSPQNGRRLHVHHVNFNKMTCCDNTIPTFVALCDSCHGKTQTNRDYWEQHFTEIVEGYYQGKCYFTKEEYDQIKTSVWGRFPKRTLPAHSSASDHPKQNCHYDGDADDNKCYAPDGERLPNACQDAGE